MSNPKEASLMRTEEYRQQVAVWIFKGIMAYRKSQEMLPSPSRLSIENKEKTSPLTQQLRPVMNLDSVPPFKPKVSASNPVVSTGTNTQNPYPMAQTNAVEGEVRRAVPVNPVKKGN
jgi:hypothetical protein